MVDGKPASKKKGRAPGTRPKNTSAPASPAAAGKHPIQGDWRDALLARVRELILEAEPDSVEERKWKKPGKPTGVPVWSKGGILCTGETYKQVVKLTFPKGASLPDPNGLFNSSLEGNARRAIDLREGETLDAKNFKSMIQAAVALNTQTSPNKSRPAPKSKAKKEAPKQAETRPGPKESKVVLLSGGNPQIAKGEGDGPVEAYLAAIPVAWKRDLCTKLDALLSRTVPKLRKAVKWNSPFYGVVGQGWFLSFHVFTRYVKVTFFMGLSLRPVPLGGTERSKDARWIDIHENASLDEAQLTKWIKQAAALPGWMA